ncbi:MAG: hypothetical protein IK093_07420 [Ruminiclostridium sp.]|nr:hypothetical protein [Ruminiclostridium sp.]
MNLIIILGGILLISVIATIILFHFEHDAFAAVTLIISVLSGVIFFVFLLLYVPVHVDYVAQKEKNKYIEQYKALMYAIEKNDNGTVLIADDIARYNSEIINGRIAMKDDIRKDFNFDFYEDLPLIELEESEENNV